MALLASSHWKLGILALLLNSNDCASSRALIWVHCTTLAGSLRIGGCELLPLRGQLQLFNFSVVGGWGGVKST